MADQRDELIEKLVDKINEMKINFKEELIRISNSYEKELDILRQDQTYLREQNLRLIDNLTQTNNNTPKIGALDLLNEQQEVDEEYLKKLEESKKFQEDFVNRFRFWHDPDCQISEDIDEQVEE